MSYEPYREYRERRAQEQAEREAALEANRRENERARAERIARLEAERGAKREEARQAEYAALEADGTKERARREWLAEDPSRDEQGFARAWPFLRDNILEGRRREEFEAALRRKRARYHF